MIIYIATLACGPTRHTVSLKERPAIGSRARCLVCECERKVISARPVDVSKQRKWGLPKNERP